MLRLIVACLIFGVVHISDVTGECPRPDEDPYVATFINDRYPLRSHSQVAFPEGTVLISRCEDVGRYRFHGEAERECLEGMWSAPPPMCKQSQTQLVIHTNANFEKSNNGSILVVAEGKQKLTITCRVGEAELMVELYDTEATVPSLNRNFKATQTVTIHKPNPSHSGLYTCRNALNDKYPPMEVEIIILKREPMCIVPDAPANGQGSQSDVDEVPLNGEIVYLCDEGYSLEGEQFARCTSSGLFNADPPTCDAHLCQPPPPTEIRDGEILGGDYYIGSSIGVLCDEGFNLNGKRFFSVECLPSLKWTDRIPRGCRPDPTDPPPTTVERPEPVSESSSLSSSLNEPSFSGLDI